MKPYPINGFRLYRLITQSRFYLSWSRISVVFFSVQKTPVFFSTTFHSVSTPSTPLLKKESCTCGSVTLGFNIQNPVLFHFSGSVSRFSTNDNPVNIRQVKCSQVFQQRLTTEEPYRSIQFLQVINTAPFIF